MPDVWFFDVVFYSIYISSLGWMCDSARFWFSSALLSLYVPVCLFVSTGRCKTNFSIQLVFIYSEKCSLLVSMLQTHSPLDLKLIYVYFQTWNMAPLFFVYFYLHIYFRHAIYLWLTTNARTHIGDGKRTA